MRTLLLLLILPLALGATLQGTVYDQDLDRAPNTLVTINTTPQQRLLSTDGSYAFNVAPGTYALTATNLETNATVTEELRVTEGEFTYDLFLLPGLDDELDDLITGLDEPPALPVAEESRLGPVLLLSALLILFLGIAALSLKRRERALEDVDEHLQELISLIREAGGRVTQRELRRKLPHSEAKVSLLVAELEAKGKVEKIKKGRGNILVLKE